MNWEAIGAIGEVLGAVAVVVTLIYLAKQMKINTTAIGQMATHSTLMGRADSQRFLASDPEISRLWWTGHYSPDDLSEEEWRRFFFIQASTVRPIEIAFLEYKAGQMASELWEAQHQVMLVWGSTPGFRRFMDAYGKTFQESFRDYLASIVREAEIDNASSNNEEPNT